MFINDLPNGKDTHHFSTEDASGSTSQAAGIVEGMEAGSRLFLLDEDTSATNFMVRDAFMQKVVSPDKEPITPFLSRARELYEQAGISTILVAGSSGAFFHIADTVIQMDRYKPVDITKKAKALCKEFPISEEKPHPFVLPHSHRIMEKDKNGATKRRDYRSGAVRKNEPERLKLKTMGTDGFAIGKQTVDLRYLEQLIDSEQTACLGMLLKYAVEHLVDGKRTIAEVVVQLQKELDTSLPDSVMLPVVCGALLSVPQKARGPDRQIIHIRLIYPERKVPDSGSQFGIAGRQTDIFFLVLSFFGKNHPRLLLIRFLHCRIRIKNTDPRIVTVKCIRCFCLGKILSGHGKIRFFDIGISFPDQCGFARGNPVFECISTVIFF